MSIYLLGIPKPTVEWKLNGRKLPSGYNPNNESVIIPSERKRSGSYSCTIRNSAGYFTIYVNIRVWFLRNKCTYTCRLINKSIYLELFLKVKAAVKLRKKFRQTCASQHFFSSLLLLVWLFFFSWFSFLFACFIVKVCLFCFLVCFFL